MKEENNKKVVIGNKNELDVNKVDDKHAKNTKKRIVFSPEKNWESHVMRVFSMEENGQTYEHKHEWPHWIYILSGKGSINIGDETYSLTKDNYLFVPGGVKHYFKNEGKKTFEWICIVPPEGDTFK